MRIIALFTCTLLACLIFFGWQNNHILFLSPFATQQLQPSNNTQKKISIFYYQQKEKLEELTIVRAQTLQKQLAQIIKAWLMILKRERIIPNSVSLESIVIDTQTQTAYVSFNCHFLQSFEPTIKKLQMIQSLLKTINVENSAITKIFFLVDHQPMQDQFLDFKQAWPITLKYY